jgi:hypothetical protein
VSDSLVVAQGREDLVAYETEHGRRISRLVVAAWSARAVLAIWMLAVAIDVGPG